MMKPTPYDKWIQSWHTLDYPTVRDWRNAHPEGKVIGTFPVWVPMEVIHAAGALPITIYGAGDQLDIEFADARMQSFICSISRSTLELGLRGYLRFLDGMVYPSICDVARNLSGVWGRNFPHQWVIFLHLPENIDSPHAVVYMKHELGRLREGLERLTGNIITDDILRNSIREYNRNRRLMTRLRELRRLEPHKLSTYELYILLRAGSVIPVEEHNRILSEALEEIGRRTEPLKDRIRVLLEGSFCEQPPLEFIWAVEEAGCYIVEDDYLLGSNYFMEPIPEEGDPWEALAQTYLRTARPSAVRYDGRTRRVDYFLERIRALDLDGVIFAYAKFCDPAQFDYIILKQHLEKLDIPYISIEFEEKMTVFETVRNQVETFVESILFYA